MPVTKLQRERPRPVGGLGFADPTTLEPKGPGKIVIPGEKVTFALLEFDFLDAGACWDRVHSVTD